MDFKKNISEKILWNVGFPDPLEENISDLKSGLKVAKAIENEWFRRDRNSDCKFYGNYHKYHLKRLYARAEQPIAKYKKEIAVDGDLSWMNVDWSQVAILPKFMDIVVNGMSNSRSFSVTANAVDKIATERKSKYVKELEKDMVAKDFLNKAIKELGINAFVNDPKEVPETSEELQLQKELNFKQGVEIANEILIDYFLEKNEFSEKLKMFYQDQAVLGKGVMKHYFNETEGIKIKYVDPAAFVHSYSQSPYHEDCYYYGEVERVPIQELRKIKPDLTKDELESIKSSSSEWNMYHSMSSNIEDTNDLGGHVCSLLHFSYKSTRERFYKKKTTTSGKVKVISKGENWNPDGKDMKDRGYSKFSKYEDVWYEGVLVLGTQMLLKWEVSSFIPRSSLTKEPIHPYIVVAPRLYNNTEESLLGRCITFADQIQLIHIKIQQIAARIVPDGIYVDVDGLNEIDLGDGGFYSPKKAMQLFFQTGSVIGRSTTSMGDYNHGSVPIKEINHSASRSKMQGLIDLYNFNLQMIRDATGLNEAVDGSTPDSRSLVGVQKLAALNSNTATRHILDSGIYVTKKISEAISERASDLIRYSDHKDELSQAVGARNVSVLEEVKNIPLHIFSIFIDVEPDAQEKEFLEKNIQAALNSGLIYLDDAAEIRETKNLKSATRLMRLKRQQKEAREKELSLEKLRVQSQEQSKTAQIQSQGKIQEEKARAESEIAIETAKADLSDRNQENEMERKEYLMGIEFDYKMGVKEREANFKRKQSNREATQNSIMTAQKSDTGSNDPVDFESEEDSLDGFSLEQFNPK